MPQWNYPYDSPYSIYQCERPSDQAQGLIPCRLREPLKSPDHIRLLKIYPPGWPDRLTEKLTRQDDSRVQCDVFQVSLASMTTPDRPYFATLSYAWGNPGVTRKLHCAKTLVSVTLNLYEALVHVRNLRTPRLLWVDSLCINQADKREKAQQVQRMHIIYGQSHCISWMGMESKGEFDIQSVLPIIKWFSEAEDHLYWHRISPTWDNLDDHIKQQPIRKLSSLHRIPWTMILKRLDRDIFNRLWCVQEILLARSNDIRSSKSHVDIAVLARSTRLIFRALEDLHITSPSAYVVHSKTGAPPPETRRLYSISSNISRMLMTAPLPCLEFKRASSPITPVSALSIISSYSARECSHPRDHVYGLAALCRLGTSYHIDYSTLPMTTQEVFADFTLHCLRTTKSLQALQILSRRTVYREKSKTNIDPSLRHRQWTPGLPTWTPDFAGPRPIMRTLKHSRADSQRRLSTVASKDHPARFKKLSRRQLGVIGIEIGTVQTCSNVWRGSRDQDSCSQSASFTWQHLSSLQNCMDTIETSVPIQKLCRLLLDVLSLDQEWKFCPAWTHLARSLPRQTGDRMTKASLGAAWIVHHLPGLASKARLTLHRWLDPTSWREIAGEVDIWLHAANDGTRLFTTDNADAIIGTGPEGLRIGDIICVLYSGDVPFILHPDGQGHYALIGECYVSGIMQGEALDMGLEEREFLLV